MSLFVLFSFEGAAANIDFLTSHAQHDSQAYVTWNGNGSPEDDFNFAETEDLIEFYFNFSTAHYPNGNIHDFLWCSIL